MSSITFEHKGDFRKTWNFLQKTKKLTIPDLYVYGEKGVAALREATPKDTGKTAECWYYEIIQNKDGSISLVFKNSNVVDGWANVAILLQYGHATRNGGYVEGRDYINPAIRPIFDEIARNLWKEVMK